MRLFDGSFVDVVLLFSNKIECDVLYASLPEMTEKCTIKLSNIQTYSEISPHFELILILDKFLTI